MALSVVELQHHYPRRVPSMPAAVISTTKLTTDDHKLLRKLLISECSKNTTVL
jgi:hypothetical protein